MKRCEGADLAVHGGERGRRGTCFCGFTRRMADPLGELALIGRAAETEIIDRLLGDAFSGRSGVLVLTGEAGVGKSALLAHARARADGMGVLQTAGVQSEAEIEFAALYQLLRPALDEVGSLPPPQSAALGAALGVEPGRPANRFLIGAAVLSVLSAAAGDRPLLCLVDDAGWLDYESAVALAFAARRLEAEAVVVIVAARSVAGTPFAGFPSRQIDGLSRSQAETLLAAHHPRVDPLIRERLIERADGNPLALLEFANQLQGAAQLAPPFAVGLGPTAVESLYLEQARPWATGARACRAGGNRLGCRGPDHVWAPARTVGYLHGCGVRPTPAGARGARRRVRAGRTRSPGLAPRRGSAGTQGGGGAGAGVYGPPRAAAQRPGSGIGRPGACRAAFGRCCG